MSIKQAIYPKILLRILPIPVVVFLACRHFQFPSICYIVTTIACGIALVVLLVSALENVRAECKSKDVYDTDIYKDFVLGMHAGKFVIGKQYFFYEKALKMHLIPIDEIERAYLKNLTIVDFAIEGQSYRKRNKKQQFLELKLNNKEIIDIRAKRETIESCLTIIQNTDTNIAVGYVEEEE